MPTFAAIDIGSNSCRMKIASMVGHRLKTLHEDREVTRLGEGVFQTGEISPDTMANTIKALRRFHKAVQLHVCDKVRVVATSAMRDARNASAFTEWVKSATGWTVEVISGLEEGRLIHLGVVTHEPGAKGKCLLIDLGGGSCEITVSKRRRGAEDGVAAAGRGAAAAGVSPARSADERGCAGTEAVYPAGAGARRTEAGNGKRAAGDCDFRHGGGAGRGERGDVGEAAGAEGGAEEICADQAAAGEDGGRATAGGQAGEDDERGTGGGAGDRAAAFGDHHRRGTGLCVAAGAPGAAGVSLLAAGAEGRDAGADDGRGGPARRGEQEDRAGTLGGRAGGVQAVRDRREEGGAGAGARGAAVRRAAEGARAAGGVQGLAGRRRR